jgi:hypothetical protein
VKSSECSRTSSYGRERPATTAPATLRSSPFPSSPSGFSRLGLLGPYPVLSRATDVPCPSFPLVTTAPRSSAPPPSPLSSRRLRRPARLPSAASPRSLSLPGYVIRSNHSRDWCNRIHVSLGAHGVRTRRIGTGRPRSDPHASPRAARAPQTRRTRRFAASPVPEAPAFFSSRRHASHAHVDTISKTNNDFRHIPERNIALTIHSPLPHPFFPSNSPPRR